MKQFRVIGYIFAYFVLLTVMMPSASALPEIRIESLQHELLRAPVEFLVAETELDLEQASAHTFHPLERTEINQGVSDDHFWLRLALSNNGDQPRSWVIFNDSTYLDNFQVHYRDIRPGTNEGEFQRVWLSDRQPYDSRLTNYRRLAFSHTTPPGEVTELYLELHYEKADTMSLNFHLMEEAVFKSTIQQENFLFGMYYGVLLILFAITLMLTLVLRQPSFFYYACFLLCTALMWGLLNGLTFQYLWPENVFWQNEGFHLAYLLFSFFAFQFSKSFFNTRQNLPFFHNLLTGLQVLGAVGVVLRLTGVYGAVLNIAYFNLLMLMVLPVLGWQAYRKGMSQARWYTLAWSFYAVAMAVSLLSAYTSLLSWGMHPLIYTQIGSLVEATVLMIAIAERVMNLDRDRREALVLAHQDPLTGLGNRRRLVEFYDNLLMTARSRSNEIFVLMIDLDNFKSINDRYGHQAGDKVLKDLAALMMSHSRSEDACIRYGGDEFLMVISADSREVAERIAERVRTQFADNPTVHDGQLIRHTLSSGVITAISLQLILSTEQMLGQVDAAMYQAKAIGKNQTVSHQA